jgi:hypothetical protein
MMKKPKELSQLYGKHPPDYLPAHNHIWHTPTFSHGDNGFRRFWIPPQWVDNGWSVCPCGWRVHGSTRDQWQTHYAWTDHVEWWKSEIEKYGSVEAAHQHIREQLRNEAIESGYDPDLVFQ